MLILAHLQSPDDLSIIGNHHQMVDSDDGHHGHSHRDGHSDHRPGSGHRDCSLPWSWETEVGRVLEGAELCREGLVKCVAVKSQHRIDGLIGLAGGGSWRIQGERGS